MTEQALFKLAADTLLQQHQESKLHQLLWLADESTDLAVLEQLFASLQDCAVSCLTNRCDIASALAHSCETSISDFDLSGISNQSQNLMVYRISKERSLVHHILLGAKRILQTDGSLILVGRKKEGIKNYYDLCRKSLGFSGNISKQGDIYLCRLTRLSTQVKQPVKLKNYTNTTTLAFEGLAFESKPGIYGWDKIDQGSAFLMQQVESLHQSQSLNATQVLDLGCGYGYLSVNAAKLLQPQGLTATDNNVTATECCHNNLRHHFPELNYSVQLDDCASKLQQKFNLILCNPPFHQGFANDFQLTEKFLSAAKRLLAPKGQAIFVFNAFVPAEKIATKLFQEAVQIANNKQFKVYLLKGL